MKLGYNKFGCSEHGYNEHLVITNKFVGQIGQFRAKIDPAITNPSQNEQKKPSLLAATKKCKQNQLKYTKLSFIFIANLL